MKVAFSGSSGSGKTTLVKFVAKEFGLEHISGSAGDIQTEEDRMRLMARYGYAGGNGHHGVIQQSAMNPGFGILNQDINQARRAQIIRENTDFVTDRSPLDNLVYFINQCGFHPEVTDDMVEGFALRCLEAWNELTHVIYVMAVQPKEVENNGSRVANWWYQQSVDAQFYRWFRWFSAKGTGPIITEIDFWDLENRKKFLKRFLSNPLM